MNFYFQLSLSLSLVIPPRSGGIRTLSDPAQIPSLRYGMTGEGVQ
jgi:hypothetical protein